MKKWLFLFCCFSTCVFVSAQEVTKRLILFGDAGEINKQQFDLIAAATNLILEHKTAVYFLGDNIYPVGMGLTDDTEQKTAAILATQYKPFRNKGVPVTFIAGNHDWDKSGKLGLAKINAQAAYITAQQDSQLRFVPQAGTAGPFVEQLSDQTIALLYDSEYWLFPYHSNPDSALYNAVRQHFLEAVKRTANDNPGKILLVMSHHPMQSYGEHSVRFSWKDHIFPLSRKWSNAYVPLPIIGSVYPILRSTVWKTAEDLKHPVYKKLVDDMTNALDDHQRVVYISGHDHGLQFIEDGRFKQIVSGSGSKASHIGKNKKLTYRHHAQGFAVLDCLDNGSLTVTFYIYDKEQVQEAFQQTIYPN